ncbi:Transglutaminase-like superfamily protein [Thermomonospora echinospora]|uniref:Transglutaminase-like superfamily protein n=1 Tax=Thermomonospora echinospora TaxID=1992 RepID=A0A1H5X2S0_9ACTN|nr:DUF3488 and transglutaminase-like domain-containing protein [Thermomonospora echinospora]SEG05660.1 Transglutaminase-like superfamily protein [Thermomonospora echinospora]
MRSYLSLPVTAGLTITAGLAFHRVFGYGPLLPMVPVAAVVPTVLAALLSGPRGSGRPWPLWISLVLTVCGWVGTVAVTVLRPALSDGTFPAALRTGLLDSWKSILTTLLPVPDRPELLVGVHAVVWLAAFAGAETALRTSWRAVACLPALGGFVLALLLGVDGPGSNLPAAAVFAGLTVALVLVRTDGAGLRALVPGVPAAAVLGALALVAGPFVPVGAEPYNPREQVRAPPPQQRDGVSPLDRVAGWLLVPDQVLFTVRASRPEVWRLAVLDRFDGVTWSSTADFVPTGSRVPRTSGRVGRRELVQDVAIRDLPGVWLPAADRPAAITGLAVAVDPASGVMAAGQPLRAGQTYRVTSAVPQWSGRELNTAVLAGDAEARAARELPWGPGARRPPVQLTEFGAFARRATEGAATPFQQAARLARFLQGHGRFDVTAPPGHGYRQLDYFLGETRRGTPEHYATAYAVLARTLGLPTRVMVGFRGGRAAGAAYEVRAGDVMVWPEVKFEGLGWVPFDPTPRQEGRGRGTGDVAGNSAQQTLEQAQEEAASAARESGAGDRPAPETTPGAAEGGQTSPWVYGVALLGLLTVAYVLTVFAVPARRRRRRRSGTPAVRIAGAWQQALEHLVDVGLTNARTLTAQEITRFGAHAVGEPALRHLHPLAELADRGRFAATPPDPQAADLAWRHSDGLGRLVTAKAGRPRRLLRRMHPRTLRRAERFHGTESPSP